MSKFQNWSKHQHHLTKEQIEFAIQGFTNKRKQTFRYNLLKPTSETIQGTKTIVPNAYISDIEKPFSLDLYKNGNITFQSLSSMIPPYCMELAQGDTVLDVCAAPGGKSLLMLEMVKNGLVVCNEIDKHRIKRLETNINRMVPAEYLKNIKITNQNGTSIKNKQFDKILVDAPCSGEGIFNIEDESSFIGWSTKNCKKRQALQKKLLLNTIPLLKANGVVVYSTCTLNTVENEQVVEYLLQQYPFMQLEDIEIDDGFLDGYSTRKDLSKCAIAGLIIFIIGTVGYLYFTKRKPKAEPSFKGPVDLDIQEPIEMPTAKPRVDIYQNISNENKSYYAIPEIARKATVRMKDIQIPGDE
ncbi:hypothetical protein HDV01_006507 [Terramyces sp. JEL0728]|nr:hypothetical protein HDV01_006507 [Terramyces sp. JEL0728]